MQRWSTFSKSGFQNSEANSLSAPWTNVLLLQNPVGHELSITHGCEMNFFLVCSAGPKVTGSRTISQCNLLLVYLGGSLLEFSGVYAQKAKHVLHSDLASKDYHMCECEQVQTYGPYHCFVILIVTII